MKVFVTGSTGVLGRRAVPLLLAAGHEVTAMARTPDKADRLARLGARPVTVDLFDAGALTQVIAGYDAVCNLATHIPSPAAMAMPGAWRENDRIRTDGSRAVVEAALAGGVAIVVQESIAYLYADGDDGWLDEASPIDPVAQLRTAVAAEGQVARFTAAGSTGVVLRLGAFHGPDSATTQLAVRLARRGLASTMGGPLAYQSPITTDDAAAAVVAALRAPAGTYNVVDDDPLTGQQYADALAVAVGRSSLRLAPKALSRIGGTKVSVLGRSQRISNRRFAEATGWQPATPSLRTGWVALAAEVLADAEPAETDESQGGHGKGVVG